MVRFSKNKSKSLGLILNMINGYFNLYSSKVQSIFGNKFSIIFFLDCFLLEDVFICAHESYMQLFIIVPILGG